MAENKMGMEQVVIVNSFDNLFGKNGELVEERKKQVLAGALEIVQRYCKETPNKMEVVAKLFDKKLGEEFRIVTPKGRIRTVKFTAEHGLLYYDIIEREWNKNYVYLNFLCEGKAVIVDD